MTEERIGNFINEGGIRLFRCLEVIAENISGKSEILDRIADALEENSSVNIAQRDKLGRIADTLDGINQELSCIAGHLEYLCDKDHPLDECISKTRAGSFLCVTGHVTTKNY